MDTVPHHKCSTIFNGTATVMELLQGAHNGGGDSVSLSEGELQEIALQWLYVRGERRNPLQTHRPPSTGLLIYTKLLRTVRGLWVIGQGVRERVSVREGGREGGSARV